MTPNYTFIYDGECPFCNHFAELLEIKSKITNIKILDGRKNLTLIESLLEKGYDLDKNQIIIDEPIKALGIYHAKVKIAKDITSDVKLYVIKG